MWTSACHWGTQIENKPAFVWLSTAEKGPSKCHHVQLCYYFSVIINIIYDITSGLSWAPSQSGSMCMLGKYITGYYQGEDTLTISFCLFAKNSLTHWTVA